MVAMSMPFVATLGDPTTVHANRDLLETDKTAAKVRLLLSFSLSLSSPLESFTTPFASPSPDVFFLSHRQEHIVKRVFNLLKKFLLKFKLNK